MDLTLLMSKPSRDMSLADRRSERERQRAYYQRHREKIITKQRELYKKRAQERKAAHEQSSAAVTDGEKRQLILDAKMRAKADPLSRWLALPPSRGFRQ